jgi:hypothetical protein
VSFGGLFMRSFLLAAGIAIPFVYFASLFVVGALTPGFGHGAEPRRQT